MMASYVAPQTSLPEAQPQAASGWHPVVAAAALRSLEAETEEAGGVYQAPIPAPENQSQNKEEEEAGRLAEQGIEVIRLNNSSKKAMTEMYRQQGRPVEYGIEIIRLNHSNVRDLAFTYPGNMNFANWPIVLSFYAVGGSTQDRMQRKRLLDHICPDTAPFSCALAGSTYDGTNLYRTPSWLGAVLPPVQWGELNIDNACAGIPQMAENDVMLVIGHLHDDEFRSICSMQKDVLEENIWMMGGKPTSYNVRIPATHSMDESQCPLIPWDQWAATLALYPEILLKLRHYQWGAFFCSRRPLTIRESKGVWTSAFYRQFNLHEIVRSGLTVEFERAVLSTAAAGGHPQFRRTLQQIEETIYTNMEEKAKIFAICKAYDDNGPWEDPLVMEQLTDSLTVVIPTFAALEVKEYDSYVCHKMLRKLVGFKEQLDPAEHMNFVRVCLKRVQGDPDAINDVYTEYLHKALIGRRVIVLHDIGVDPMCNDWLAIAMLWSVAMVRPTEPLM
eukprot:NODE_5342_length_1781_cov_5.035067.p1 GENE.NODE_5342_length_1781_cov_5.035067~~NODE_5342_length_1781_cov_5.035067.p1  ORF type:complete len:518 (-),score=154.35 NODE_5342_length_1781_cov_5.035067:228-1733(-)